MLKPGLQFLNFCFTFSTGSIFSKAPVPESSQQPTSPAENHEAKLTELISNRAPIMVDLKSGRHGLGHPQTKRLKLSLRTSDKPEDINQRFYQNETDFRAAKRNQTLEFYARKDYESCQRACANLESGQGMSQSIELLDDHHQFTKLIIPFRITPSGMVLAAKSASSLNQKARRR